MVQTIYDNLRGNPGDSYIDKSTVLNHVGIDPTQGEVEAGEVFPNGNLQVIPVSGDYGLQNVAFDWALKSSHGGCLAQCLVDNKRLSCEDLGANHELLVASSYGDIYGARRTSVSAAGPDVSDRWPYTRVFPETDVWPTARLNNSNFPRCAITEYPKPFSVHKAVHESIGHGVSNEFVGEMVIETDVELNLGMPEALGKFDKYTLRLNYLRATTGEWYATNVSIGGCYPRLIGESINIGDEENPLYVPERLFGLLSREELEAFFAQIPSVLDKGYKPLVLYPARKNRDDGAVQVINGGRIKSNLYPILLRPENKAGKRTD